MSDPLSASKRLPTKKGSGVGGYSISKFCDSKEEIFLRRRRQKMISAAKTKNTNAAIMAPTMPPSGSLDADELASELAVGKDEWEEDDEMEDDVAPVGKEDGGMVSGLRAFGLSTK